VPPRREIVKTPGYDIVLLGGKRPGLRDLYHALLRMPWWGTLIVIVGGYLALNAIFATVYLLAGGVANLQPGDWLGAFFFSVQTMGTIGYGVMYPTTRLANVIMVAESVTGLVATALATGLVFVRFSQTRPRVLFSARVAIGLLDGVPMLMLRVGNERRNSIVDANFRVTLTRTTRTSEGVLIYRAVDLVLVRARAPALSRLWSIMHRIEPGTPLHGETPESLAAKDAELSVEVMGIDDVSLQPVFARQNYMHTNVVWGARPADAITETQSEMIVDLRKFHDLEPTEATDGFPYCYRETKG
jgi:inward rectifier potassium channel